jgi:hypothetical protein
MNLREQIALAMSRHGVIDDALYHELLALFNQWLEEQGAGHFVIESNGITADMYEPLRLE